MLNKSLRLIFIITITAVTTLTSCSVFTAKNSDTDANFLKDNSECHKGILKSENDLRFLSIYSIYREHYFKTPDFKPGLIITGDSTSALFMPQVSEKYLPGLPVLNRGIPGDTTFLFKNRMKNDIVPFNPGLLMIAIGGNDLLQDRCYSEILYNIQAIVEELRTSLPKTRILIVSIPPTITEKTNSAAPYMNRKIEEITGQYKNVYFIDLWSRLADPEKSELKEQFHIKLPNGKVDSIHFNEQGYEKWAEILKESPHLKFAKPLAD